MNEITSPVLSEYEYVEEQQQSHKKKQKGISLSARESTEQKKSQVSMGQLSLNSVTDEYYIAACNETEQSQAVRKQMIRYLSRVSDKNKPLFMFNQKLKVGRSEESDGEGCGTPRFSVVSFVFQ